MSGTRVGLRRGLKDAFRRGDEGITMPSAFMRCCLAVGIGLGLGLASAPVHAVGLQPLSQDRYVDATTRAWDTLNQFCGEPGEPPCNESVSAQASAPDFGPFDASVAPTCAFLDCPAVSASQTSTITASGIHVSGSTLGYAYYAHEGTQTGSSSAHAGLDVFFQIDQPTPYTISSLLSVQDFSEGFPYVGWLLAEVGGASEIAVGDCYETQGVLPCDQLNVVDGILQPGQYRFRLSATADAYLSDYPLSTPNFTGTTFDVHLQLVPEPGTGLLMLPGVLALALGRRRGGGRSQVRARAAGRVSGCAASLPRGVDQESTSPSARG
jgi:hypothetical protein